jgi:DNA replication licensing factor MCM5
MDTRSVYSLSVLAPTQDGIEDSPSQVQAQLREFILAFQLDNSFLYRYSIAAEDVMAS